MLDAIFLSGPINAGKSTVGRLLSQSIPESVFIDGDDLAPMGVPLAQKIPVVSRRLVEAVAEHARLRRLVVAAYPVSREDWRVVVGDMTSRELQGQFVTLAPRIEVALSERGGRVLDDWEMRRIPEMYR